MIKKEMKLVITFHTTTEAMAMEKECKAAGGNILTCGTCLDFYGIKEKLAVGSVTNMYEIVEKMETAKRIVRP